MTLKRIPQAVLTHVRNRNQPTHTYEIRNVSEFYAHNLKLECRNLRRDLEKIKDENKKFKSDLITLQKENDELIERIKHVASLI